MLHGFLPFIRAPSRVFYFFLGVKGPKCPEPNPEGLHPTGSPDGAIKPLLGVLRGAGWLLPGVPVGFRALGFSALKVPTDDDLNPALP